MTFDELKLRQLSRFIHEWEDKLRHMDKYSENPDTTWSEVRDMYHELRSEFLIIDLLDESLDASQS